MKGLDRQGLSLEQDAGMALEIFGDGQPFTGDLVGGELDLEVQDTVGLRITDDIHGQTVIGAQDATTGNCEPKKTATEGTFDLLKPEVFIDVGRSKPAHTTFFP